MNVNADNPDLPDAESTGADAVLDGPGELDNPSAQPDAPTGPDYESWSGDQLLEELKVRGLKVKSKASKKVMAAALVADDNDDEPEVIDDAPAPAAPAPKAAKGAVLVVADVFILRETSSTNKVARRLAVKGENVHGRATPEAIERGLRLGVLKRV